MYTEYGLRRSNAMQCTNLARLPSDTFTWGKNIADLEKKRFVLVLFGDVEMLTSSYLIFLEHLSLNFLWIAANKIIQQANTEVMKCGTDTTVIREMWSRHKNNNRNVAETQEY